MDNIRVRFAPSPTGIMHLGNVRSALMNYLFAKKKNGTFVLRIEDTDFKRNVENLAFKIIEDLLWLGLIYDEGPLKDGHFGPYYQSQRTVYYNQYLNELINKKLTYRCFCTSQELEEKRNRQIMLKQPPRYNRTCLELSEDVIEKNLKENKEFIWRFKLDHNKTVKFYDLAHKQMAFELKHFSDIPITRQDGTFTFVFANFVDDHLMKITHVFRGEEHLSNTASQIALYQAFDAQVPIFWHLPLIGNIDGKKLSKRDFGFSLIDLQNAGYLSEAICNYLIIIGGSYRKEILNRQEMIEAIDFENLSPTGMIKYDVDKLRWVNHQWILNYANDSLKKEELINLCVNFIVLKYPQVKELQELNKEKLNKLISIIVPELVILKDSVDLVSFYFDHPLINFKLIENFVSNKDILRQIINNIIELIKVNRLIKAEDILDFIKKTAKENNQNLGNLFKVIRFALTGKFNGPTMAELLDILEIEKIIYRLSNLLAII